MDGRVIIVGGGPVGLVAALKLARAGVSVTVLERATEMHAEPRASTFHAPTLELLDTLGLTEKLIALGRAAPQWQYRVFETGDAAVFDMTLIADETRYPFRLQCEQFNLVKVAVEALNREAPGAVIFGAEVTDISQTADEVRVTFTHDGHTQSLNGAWLIAADGAASAVRTKLGISFEGSTYPQVSFTVGTTFPLHEHMNGLLGVNYFWSDFGPWGQFRTGLMWRVGWSPPLDSINEDILSDDVVQAKLAKICPAGAPYDLITARLYRTHRRIAGTFTQGRIALAGDAAHLNSPTGGFGMNGGVQDAFNLTGKLVEILNGAKAEPLLDRYTRQRRSAAVDDIQSTSDTNYRRHREKDPAKRLEALKDLQAITADRDRHRAYLLDNALINSYRRSEAIP
ncbi:MAG: FAD-dependent monooxygenase [Rhodospirillaceae bacterium]|nr:FAD-dependent monooxygenase [Rhodospirillaceae bacterium]